MQDYGLVSIITPSYNCARFIEATIRSIQSQTYENWELLITDDNSTDSSCNLIEKISRKDKRIKLFKLEKNSGAGVARNNSIKNAHGKFIAFCDSDDQWLPNKLKEQLSFMIAKDCALSYTSYLVCNERGDDCGVIHCKPTTSYANILQDNRIGCLTAMYNSEKIGKQYFPDIRKRQDWALWIKIIKEFGNAYGLDIPLAKYRIRQDSISANKFKLIKYNYSIYRDILNFNPFVSAVLLACYFMPYYAYKKVVQKIYHKK